LPETLARLDLANQARSFDKLRMTFKSDWEDTHFVILSRIAAENLAGNPCPA